MSPRSSPIPLRVVPGGGLSVSLLGLVVDPVGPAGAVADRALVERLRRAREGGVTLFDTAGSRDSDRAQALVATAFSERDPAVVVIVRDAAGPEPLRPGSSSLPRPSTPPAAVGQFRTIREVAPSPTAGPAGPGASPNNPSTAAGSSVAVRLMPGASSLPPHPGGGLYSGPFSLLDRRLRPLFEPGARGAPIGLLARDPFAGGRLDGSRFAQSGLELGPSMSPPSLRALEREFEPVLQLGFLTAEHKRTLAQAAVQYVAGHPWVVSVLVPLPPADRLEELLEAFTRPPLTAEEVSRVEAEAADSPPLAPGPSLK
ncbi:MAG TPA: aldo/keto reductase [Thermoplasmata archaeon]|nr:aldo/keto reductase [Thermoplasmata archaeon]